MAPALIWSRRRLDDIDRIAEYISQDSRYHAQQVVERLFDLGKELPAHPKLVPELGNIMVRERFLYSGWWIGRTPLFTGWWRSECTR